MCVCAKMMNGMASSSSGGSSSSSLTKTATAGSYSRGGTVTLWPNPVPLECGIIRTLDKDKPSSSSAVKHGGQRFPTGVSLVVSAPAESG